MTSVSNDDLLCPLERDSINKKERRCKPHHHIKNSLSINVMKSKCPNKIRKSLRRSVAKNRDLSKRENYSETMLGEHQLHPVKLGRCKLKAKDRCKFARMSKDGGTSLAIMANHSYGNFQKLGEKFKRKPCKPSRIQIITDNTFEYLKSQRYSQYSDDAAALLSTCSFTTYQDPFQLSTNSEESLSCEANNRQPTIDFVQLRSLEELGIDVSFIDYFERELVLENTGKLILDLMEEQNKRLSDYRRVRSSVEREIVDSLLSGLVFLAKSAKPGDLAPAHVVHHVLGINI